MQAHRVSALAFVFAAAFAAPAIAGIGAGAPEGVRRLVEGNERFRSGYAEAPRRDPARMKEVAGGQKPFAVVLTCADSRVPPEVIFDQGLGDLFVVRVAGNVVAPTELASVEYAVEHLGARLVVVLGHSKCGAVSAACDPKRPEGNIGKLVDLIAPAVTRAKKDAPRDKAGLVASAVRHNVSLQASRLGEQSKVLREFGHAHGLATIGAVYDLDSGAVSWLPSVTARRSGGH